MCFYSAVHYVEAFAVEDRGEIRSVMADRRSMHSKRKQYLQNLSYRLQDPDLVDAYESLEEQSHMARYLSNIDTDSRAYFESKGCEAAFEDIKIVRESLTS